MALLLGVGSAGAGHGDYLWAKLLFPMTMASAQFLEEITPPFILLAIIQYPVYGMILGFANRQDQLDHAIVALTAAHLLFVALCFAAPQEGF
ncbi:MAG: hypothetical protein H6509_01055 [Bryobacterales bacterium]|nr:hypothetical protein [Bryobacterales bacterium]